MPPFPAFLPVRAVAMMLSMHMSDGPCATCLTFETAVRPPLQVHPDAQGELLQAKAALKSAVKRGKGLEKENESLREQCQDAIAAIEGLKARQWERAVGE